MDCVKGQVQEVDIAQIYYLRGVKSLIALVPGIYGGSGFKLVKYGIESGELSIAEREDIHGGKTSAYYKVQNERMKKVDVEEEGIYRWFDPPSQIEGYDYAKNKLLLSGSAGDAGCWGNSKYEYDPEKNYIKIVSTCSGCEGEEEACVEYK